MKGKPNPRTASAAAGAAAPEAHAAEAAGGEGGAQPPEASRSLDEQDRLYRDIVERACELIYRTDLQGRFTYVNPATAKLTGFSRPQLLGSRLIELVREDFRPQFEKAFAKLTTGGAPLEYIEIPIVTRAGREVWLGQATQLLVSDSGAAEIQGEARDVTEQRRVREAVIFSEQRLRAVVEGVGEGLIVTDAEDRVLYVNPAFERITGYSAADLVGNRAFDLMTEPGDTNQGAATHGRGSDTAERYELRIRHGAGHWVVICVVATPLRDGGDEPFAMIAAISDITDQKRLERAREESEERFRQISETIKEAFWITSLDLRTIHYASAAYAEILGTSPDAPTLGHASMLDLLHPDDRELVEQATHPDQLIADGFELEFRVIRADGEVRWIYARGFPVREADGQVHRIAGVAEDITDRRAAREAIRRSEASYRSLYNSLTDLVYIQDLEGRFLNVNDAVVEAYGYHRDELIGESPAMLADPERVDLKELGERVRLAAEGKPQRFEFWGRRKDGSTFPKEVVLTRADYFDHQAVMAVARDISERKQAEADSERLAALSRENPNPVLEVDASGRPVHVNPAADAVAWELGLDSVEGLLPANHRELVGTALDRGDGFRDVEVMAAGRIFEWTYRPHPASGVVHLFATEVTGRRLMEEQLRHDALHDSLTDLPNRLLFMERLEHVVQRARRQEGNVFAILFLDLDRFKVVNDSLGHHIGDELLVTIADRLRGSVRTEDTVARFGGDEFAILVESIGDVSDATRVAERVHEALAPPLHLEGYELVISASIGIAIGSSAEDLPADLLRNADMAMYRAKSSGSGHYEVFERGMRTEGLNRLQIETDLRYSLERGELVLEYQPVVDLTTGRISTLEALLRWEHPERGRLPPNEFLPLAEETGMIRSIGGWVLVQACRQFEEWRTEYGAAAPDAVSVNVSAKQFARDELLRQVQRALRQSGLPASALCLEIAETAMSESMSSAVDLLQRMKLLGVRICVDDFGTGYSSLTYLQGFPVDEVKIDGSIVRRVSEETGALQVVRTMTTLAHSLDAACVAEAVETPDQLETLLKLGVDRAQGFLLARPLSTDAVAELLRSGGTIPELR